MKLTDAELRELLELESRPASGTRWDDGDTAAFRLRNLARPLAEEVLRLREALRRAGYAIDSMRVADVMQCSHPNIQAEIEEALRDAD